MIHEDLTDMVAGLPPGSRLMGFDVGSKTIGLAIGDSGHRVATAIETFRRGKFSADAPKLLAVMSERNVGGIVLGLPVSMDGSEGPACQSVRQFAANLDAYLSANTGGQIGLAFWDERLSTSAVERFLVQEADLSRGRRAKVVDKLAAAYILQGALDFIAGE